MHRIPSRQKKADLEAKKAGQKRVWQHVDGVLLLDKPRGVTSNTALQIARRLYSAAKAGHTGTLDPMATGLLPLCFGEATKFSADLLNADKTYEAALRFGETTTTGDAEGEVLERRMPQFSRADLEHVLESFRGRIVQIPPMYSALKRDGQPLYKLARQGITVEREAREIDIFELILLDLDADGSACRLHVRCSKGTYIRTLAEDIGCALGCGAHLIALRRTGVGDLLEERTVTLEALEALSEEERKAWLLPVDALLQGEPKIVLDKEQSLRFAHGNPVNAGGALHGRCRVYSSEGALLGVGHIDMASVIHPHRLVATR